MLGHPKFKEGDSIAFEWKKDEPHKIGTVYVVDKYGVVGDESDVHYDIVVDEERCIYKHIREDYCHDII